MKKLINCLLCFIILILLQINVFAVGEGNIDGGGGEMGNGLDKYYWSIGNEGVRVTIIRNSDNTAVFPPVDFTNKHPDNIQIHFGKVSKIHYRNVPSLNLNTGKYTYNNPAQSLPRIISTNGSINIEAIKRYFCSEYAIMMVANMMGFSYEQLISGQYKLLIEPIAYFTYNAMKVAMTAHEAALYDQMVGGKLRYYMPSLTHKNLPLAMFLETSDLGFAAWDGPTDEKVTDNQIISSLGLGIVRFKEADSPAVIGETDFEYRVDTDVITAVTVNTDKRITPDNPATVTFYINGSVYTVTDVVIPAQDSQVVWVKWHTPINPATINIAVSTSRGNVSQSTLTARIVDLKEKVPPNPTAYDTRPIGYRIPAIPAMSQRTSASWGVWGCYWKPKWEWEPDWKWETDWEWESDWDWVPNGKGGGKWVDHGIWVDNGEWVDHGEWVDNGDWEYTYTGYWTNLAASMDVTPDAKVPTAYGENMRSGYGINLNVKTNLQSNALSSAITGVQNILSYYPEFNYNRYLRLSDMLTGGYSAEFELKPNEFSAYERRVHFTPLWFPDGRYALVANVIDAWTPDGMLSISLSDYVDIQGNLYDDWHIAPKR